MPFTLIFPVIPWLLQLILFGWFVVVLAYPFWPSIPCHLSPLTCLNGYQWNTTGGRTLWWSSILRREEQICSQTTSLAWNFLFSQHRSYNISQGNVPFVLSSFMCARAHAEDDISKEPFPLELSCGMSLGKKMSTLKRPFLFHLAKTRISFSYMISCVTSSANYDKLKLLLLSSLVLFVQYIDPSRPTSTSWFYLFSTCHNHDTVIPLSCPIPCKLVSSSCTLLNFHEIAYWLDTSSASSWLLESHNSKWSPMILIMERSVQT